MEILIPMLVSTIAGLSTVIGSLIIFIKIKSININKFISLCLSFSLSIMIGISILELIPEALNNLLYLDNGIIISILSLAIGIISIKILSVKIENQKTTTNNLYRLGILNMIALMIHNFPEGIVTFLSSMQNINLGIKLGVAIALHNIPEGISIAVPIYYATKNKKEALKKTLASAMAEPLGAILAYLLFKNFITNNFISVILMIVAGIMITISIEEIFPEALKYKENKWIIIGLLTGLIVILINYICF